MGNLLLLFIFIVCSVTYALLGFAKCKYFFNPCTVLNFIFGLSFPFGSVGLYGTDIPRWQTILLILLGQTCFTLGYLVGLKTKMGSHIRWQGTKSIQINLLLVYFIAIVSFVYTLGKFGTALSMLRSGLSITELRWTYFSSNSLIKNPVDDFLDTGLINGFRIALMMIAVIELFFNKHRDWKLLSLIGMTIIMKVFTNSGRMFLYDMIFALIVGYSYKRYIFHVVSTKRFRLSWRQKIFGAAGIAGVVAIMINFTLKRQIGQSALESIYDIFTCFVVLLDKTMQMASESGDITYGVTSFDGIFIIINMGLSFLGLPQNTTVNILNKYDAPFWSIGSGKQANAYLSYIFSFYLDFRVIGIILGSCIFGVIAARVFKKALQVPNKHYLAGYMMLIFVISRCSIRWALGKADFFIALLVLALVYKKDMGFITTQLEKGE